MSRKNNNSPKTIKYSIWETKTENSHNPSIENSPVSFNKHNDAKQNRNDG